MDKPTFMGIPIEIVESKITAEDRIYFVAPARPEDTPDQNLMRSWLLANCAGIEIME